VCVAVLEDSKNRTIDFSIENEVHLFAFIHFIQHYIMRRMNKKGLKSGRTLMKLLKNKHDLKPKKTSPIQMKYFRLIKIKMKIGYEALRQGQTIGEFFINAILKAYLEREENKDCLDQDKEKTFPEETIFSWKKVLKDVENSFVESAEGCGEQLCDQ